MKVLHIVPFYKPAYIYGGPIASVSKLCESEVVFGAEVKVLTTNANGKNQNLDVDTRGFVNVNGVEVFYFDSLTNNNTFISFGLWRFLIKNGSKYDLIHIHSWWNFLVLGATFISKLKGLKIVLSPRGMLSDYIFNSTNSKIKHRLHNLFGKKLLQGTIFNATSEQEHLECEALIPGWKGFTIPNIIDLPEIEIVKSNNAVFTLSFLSRVDPKKGLEFVFEAISLLTFKVKLRIAGEGEEEYISQLKTLAKSYGIEDQIEWIGWIGPDKKFHELMSADLFILASYNENFANVVIESLYVGTPVLISKHVGLASFVEQMDLGWVVDLDANEIAENISSAALQSEKSSRIHTTAHDTIKKTFSPQVLVKKYLDVYDKIVKKTF
jgi:glycosyltransferase involved in cell wall biosynthesis